MSLEKFKLAAEIGKLIAETLDIFRKRTTDDRIEALERKVAELEKKP